MLAFLGGAFLGAAAAFCVLEYGVRLLAGKRLAKAMDVAKLLKNMDAPLDTAAASKNPDSRILIAGKNRLMFGVVYQAAPKNMVVVMPTTGSDGAQTGWHATYINGDKVMESTFAPTDDEMYSGFAPYLTTWMRNIDRNVFGELRHPILRRY